MKKLLLPVLFLFFGINVNAQNKEWTLEECVAYALENNISIKQSELEVDLAEIDRAEAVGNFLPRLNASASNSWNTGLTQNVTTGILQTQTTRNFSAGATASANLSSGLSNWKRLQLAKLSQLASEYSLEQMKDDIALFVANAYLQVLFNKESLKVIEAQHEITLEQLERVQELVEAGSLPRGDLLEIKATAANEEQRMIVAENNVKVSLIALAQTLLIKDYENFDIAERDYEIFGSEVMEMPVSEVIENAKEERYEVKVAQANLEMAQKETEITKADYWPNLAAFFNYNTRETDYGRDPLPFFEQLQKNDGISYGVQLDIPIFNGFSTRNSVKRREVNVLRSQYQLEQTKLDLESDVYQAYVDAKGALKAYEAALVALEAQSLAYDYATERYNVGLTNAFDFSQAKFNFENAQSEVVRTKYEYIFNLKVLELYFGVPATELKF